MEQERGHLQTEEVHLDWFGTIIADQKLGVGLGAAFWYIAHTRKEKSLARNRRQSCSINHWFPELCGYFELISSLTHSYNIWYLMPTFQLLLDPDFSTSAEPWLRKYTLITLRRICQNTLLYPQSYVLNDIKDASHLDGGGFCDIYRGSYNEQVLCLKVVRLFQKSDKDKMLKVRGGFPLYASQ